MVHLVNGLLDARKEGAPVIAIAGDVETSVLDSDTVEELNPYVFFAAADLAAMAALINEAQTVAIFGGDGCSDATLQVRTLGRKAERAGRLLAEGQAVAGA